MDKFLVIENNGLLDPNALILMGASTKREDNEKIGMFGTGNKYALAYLLRNNFDLRIIADNNPIEIMTEEVKLKDQTYKQVFVDGKQTSITTELGKDWKLWHAIRELYSNAVDEGLVSFNMVDESELANFANQKEGVESEENIEAKEPTTKIIIKANDDLLELFKEKEKYFLHPNQIKERILIEDSYYGQALQKDEPSPMIVFLNGIRVNALDEEQLSIFDYNITNREYVTIDERRIIADFYKEYFPSSLIAKSENDVIADAVINEIGKNNFKLLETTAFLSARYDNSKFNKEKLKEYFEPKTIVSPTLSLFTEKADLVKATPISDEAYQYLSSNEIITEENLPESIQKKSKGSYLCKDIDINDVELYNYNKAIEVMKFNNYEIPYPVRFVEFLEEKNKNVLGRADFKNQEVLLSRVTLSRGFQDIINTLIEENTHLKYGVYDETRAMQDSLIAEFSTVMVHRFELEVNKGHEIDPLSKSEKTIDMEKINAEVKAAVDRYTAKDALRFLPKEALVKLGEYQYLQGNDLNLDLLDFDGIPRKSEGGLDFGETPEGHDFWQKVTMGEPDYFYSKYPDPSANKWLEFDIKNYVPKDEVKNLPLEIIAVIVQEIGKQGRPFNIEYLEENGKASFDWHLSKNGHVFWANVFELGKHEVFFEKYPNKIEHSSDILEDFNPFAKANEEDRILKDKYWAEKDVEKALDFEHYIPTGNIANVPKEVIEKMMVNQVLDGNKPDVTVFEAEISSPQERGGFDWDKSKEGEKFWMEVIYEKRMDIFFEEFPLEKYDNSHIQDNNLGR